MQFPPPGSEGIRFAKPAAATTKKPIPKEGLVRELYKKWACSESALAVREGLA